ncbi:hypothetical protein [Hydrogenophaga sp.]|uniref:hypothetical protein n=1 Tax=Hydrogenophaga sp. TaxID=1904254 RepID=UPI003568D3EA
MNPALSKISTTGNDSDKLALSAFMKALAILSKTRDYNAVAAPFADFKNLNEDENSGGTFRVHGEKIYNVIVHFEITQEPPHEFMPVVGNLGLLFETGAVTLSDVQEILGDWYRDPVDGVQASFADAYFNAKNIAPEADYLLCASTKEGYVETLNPSAPVEMISASWQDNRYNTENRPW